MSAEFDDRAIMQKVRSARAAGENYVTLTQGELDNLRKRNIHLGAAEAQFNLEGRLERFFGLEVRIAR